MAKRMATATKGRVRRRPRRASASTIVDPDLAPYLSRMKRLAEAQKLIDIAADRLNALVVRLGAFHEYSRRFDSTAMEKIRAILESDNAVRH